MLKTEMVERDEDGDWTHSELTTFLGDREYVPKTEWLDWCAQHSIETQIHYMEYDLDENHPAWIRYFDEGNAGSIGWNPVPPGSEWHMLSIHDTEDGPVVIWYREVPPADQEQSQ